MGYSKITTKKLTQAAGQCGSIEFDLFSKPCTMYMRADPVANLCAQKCLPAKVGQCDTDSVVAKNGQLTKGTCASMGYSKNNNKKLTQAAGQCGSIEFDLFSKPCTMYMRADPVANLCAQKCLQAKVGQCDTDSVVAKNGQLTKGTCASMGYTKNNNKKLTQAAGQCGSIEFDLFSK